MSQLILKFCLLSIAAAPTLGQISSQTQSDLHGLLSSDAEVISTGDASYESDFTQRWTVYEDVKPTYALAAKPASKEDVQKIVQYAAENGIPFMATGGGHGYSTTLSSITNALDIDLSNFKGVSIDGDSMTVGGADTFADMYDPLYKAGKQLQAGGSSSPGIVGVTLGGGIGPATGAYGLVIDALQSVEMVTGSGKILTASETENSDLFWGMRGAGQNFGIVVSAVYKVHDAPNDNQVMNADLVFDASKNGTIFEILETYQDAQDKYLSVSVSSSLRNGAPSIAVSAVYFGSLEDGKGAISKFIEADPTISNITEVAYNRLVYVANFGADVIATQKGVLANLWGYQINKIDVPTLISTYNDVMDFLLDNPSLGSGGMWLLEKFSLEVTASISDDSTAYPWRSAVAYGFFEFNLPDSSSETVSNVNNFLKKRRSGLTSGCGNPDGNIYVNYARGDESAEQIYGANKLDKLRSLKKTYDPNNLFSNYNAFS